MTTQAGAPGMVVVNRFETGVGALGGPGTGESEEGWRAALERAHRVLAGRPGYLSGDLGRNVDDPARWVLVTRWEGPGAYRRALSSYEVKVDAWDVLGRAVDEPGAYECVVPGEVLNRAAPRGSG